MNNDEVIKWLKYIKDMYSWNVNCDKSLDIAIKTLEQELKKDDIILTKKEYRELLSSEFDNGYSKGYREILEQEQNAWENVLNELELYANHKLTPVSFEQCIAIDRCINIVKTSLKSI